MVSVLRPGARILHIPGFGVQTSRRAVSGGNGLLNGLVAYWSLNEAAGANNALDLHTNALTLTQVSSPGADTGKVYSGARTFDGSADYFTRASETLLQTGDVDFTLAAWVYLTNNGANKTIVAKAAAGKSEQFLFYSSSTNRYVFSVYAPGDTYKLVLADAFGIPPLDAWSLLFAWHDSAADTVNIAVNNGAANSAATGGTIQAVSNASFRIGVRSDHADMFYQGRIGPVAFWKSAAGGGGVLSSSQRSALWNGGAGLPYASFTI